MSRKPVKRRFPKFTGKQGKYEYQMRRFTIRLRVECSVEYNWPMQNGWRGHCYLNNKVGDSTSFDAPTRRQVFREMRLWIARKTDPKFKKVHDKMSP